MIWKISSPTRQRKCSAICKAVENPSLRIVPMEERHIAALAELERLCFSRPRSASLLREELSNPPARFFVAEWTDGSGKTEIAGYAGMQSIAGECYVENIAVFPALRGRGIGRALTTALLTAAAAEHSAFVTLEVRSSNEAAIGLYRSLGFTEVGERKNFYCDPAENALLMTRYFDTSAKEL